MDETLAEIESSFVDVLIDHLDEPITCDSPMREQLALIQWGLKKNPEVARAVKKELAKAQVYDREHMRHRAQEHIRELNDFMQGYRIFCVTTHNKSDRMWTEYADGHRGAMIRIEPNYSRDSKFRLFRPVQYQDERPPLFSSTEDFIVGSFFRDRSLRIRAMIERIIYTKTRQWEHEAEYRLAIPLARGEESWDVLPYHPDEVSELYLGAATNENEKNEIVELAIARNPNIGIFETDHQSDDGIGYQPVQS